ncbi:response regulator [Dyella koreensis]|uniref:Response regulator n=1 Tax=Dyella koreensis TaxID=311235 RepID=A0ABW8K948_9GAMM
MKLEYKILWFDDNEEMYQSIDFDPLRQGIDGWGFVPEIEFVSNPDDFLKRSPFTDYDLIVVDYNLEEHGQGQDFIAKIRDQEVYTEIIFYSAGKSSSLWEAVGKYQLEGIYIANKTVIIEKILKVGLQTLRKVLDVGNMRGIVMAEVGDLDHSLDVIVRTAIDSLNPEQRRDVFDRFHQASEALHGKHKEKLDSFKEAPSVDVLLMLCDSNKRWANYNRAKDHHETLKSVQLGDYVKEILVPRNFLAHGVPEPGDNGTEIFKYQGKSYIFSDEVGIALRKKIIEYKLAFNDISRELASRTVQSALDKAAESDGPVEA